MKSRTHERFFRATVVRRPTWVSQMPRNTRSVVNWCVGRTFTVIGIDENGLIGLDLGAEVEMRFGGFQNTTWMDAHDVAVETPASES